MQNGLFLYKTLDVDGVNAADRAFGTRDFHDMGEMISRGFAELGLAIAARIVLFIHEHEDGAILSEQSDGLAAIETFLAAGFVLLAVLAQLKIAGEIDDLASNGDDFARERLPVYSGADGSGAPGLGRFIAKRAHGFVPTAFGSHSR